jgi:hypothetical protein
MPAGAFSAVIDALFADRHLALDAVYRAGGADPGVPVRAIVRRPDRVGAFGETRIVAETVMIDVRVSEVATPCEGDTIGMNGTLYVIQGEPVRNAERLVWTLEARPG